MITTTIMLSHIRQYHYETENPLHLAVSIHIYIAVWIYNKIAKGVLRSVVYKITNNVLQVCEAYLKAGMIKYNLAKVSHIEFEQNPLKDL
jgi:hypothetical protein